MIDRAIRRQRTVRPRPVCQVAELSVGKIFSPRVAPTLAKVAEARVTKANIASETASLRRLVDADIVKLLPCSVEEDELGVKQASSAPWSSSLLIAGGLVGEALRHGRASNHSSYFNRHSHFWANVKLSGTGRCKA